MGQASIGIIGGSSVYDIAGLENKRWKKIESPFGATSDELLFGELSGVKLAFLPRHGRGHKTPPSEINFRAHIDVLKRVGADAKACECGCRSALQYTLITAPEARDAVLKQKLQAIAGRVL